MEPFIHTLKDIDLLLKEKGKVETKAYFENLLKESYSKKYCDLSTQTVIARYNLKKVIEYIGVFVPEEHIICSAIHFKDDKKHSHQPKNIESGFVVCGRRHHNCYLTLSAIGKSLLDTDENEPIRKKIQDCGERETQGFLTNTDRFVDRKEAYKIAFEANQLKDEKEFNSNKILISEMLY